MRITYGLCAVLRGSPLGLLTLIHNGFHATARN